MTDAAKPRRRWLLYSLITLLVLVVLAGIAMTWVAIRVQRTMRQSEAVEAILEAGGVVRYDFEVDQSGNRLPKASLPGPAWVRYWTGYDLDSNVVEAEVQTDATLEGIKDLPLLRRLHLFSTRITDAGLRHLKMSPQLEVLYLENVGVTDVGLQHLEQLPQLKGLYLDKTQVTEKGVMKLQKALPNCVIAR